MTREVTEADIRLPEFKYAKLEDLEIRHDGKVVRKDRWETGIYSIASKLDITGEWEISDIVEAVKNPVNKLYEIVSLIEEQYHSEMSLENYQYLIHSIAELIHGDDYTVWIKNNFGRWSIGHKNDAYE